MKFSTLLATVSLSVISTVIAAPAAAPSAQTVKIGRRDLILPPTCRGNNSAGVQSDFMPTLQRGLAEVDQLIASAITLPPDQFDRWFAKWLDIIDHTFWVNLTAAAGRFNLPDTDFSTIAFDCETLPPECTLMTELDGTPRLAITDWADNIIYACPALFAAADNTKLIGAAGPNKDLFCPDVDQPDVEARSGLPAYYVFATTLVREIAHTGSAIRRTGSFFQFDDLTLHAKVERFGWMSTHAFFMRLCDYEIPLDRDAAFDTAILAPPKYDNPVPAFTGSA